MISTPIALLIFNRPDLTEIVFRAIAQAQPPKLLIVADGPRSLEESERCQQARDIINKINWNCELLTNFSETNLGCKVRVSTGIDWVFSKVEDAIILEDDCLPVPSFFTFCETLLDYYRDDERIMHISGNNFQMGQSRTNASYYFSKYNHIWGWATWRRAWKHFDRHLETWAQFKQDNLLEFICKNPHEVTYWTERFDRVFAGEINTWDAQWLYACWSQAGLSILPNINLVSNLGFRQDATHTIRQSPLAELPTGDIYEIEHPQFMVEHQAADAYTFDHLFGGEKRLSRSRIRSYLSQLKAKLS